MALWDVVFLYFRIMSGWMYTVIMIWIPVTALLIYMMRLWVRWRGKQLLPHLRVCSGKGERPLLVGFFHPYCNAGGGGERVLWVAIRALQNRYPNVKCVVFSGDVDATGKEILQKVRQRFNIVLPRSVDFVFLQRRGWVEAKPYPYFTLLGQSLGSLVLGWEALMKFVPDVYLDTMGYAFTLPLFKYFGGCRVGCYVHYPTISTDMLERVSQRSATFNNAGFVSRSPLLSNMKLLYYRIFAYAYGVVGKRSDVVMVNSTWTHGHILGLWQVSSKTHIVYPPCDTTEFEKMPLVDKSQNKIQTIVSIAQFRPEKDHPLQVRAFQEFLQKQSAKTRNSYKLVLVGSCRNAEDLARVDALRSLCKELEVQDLVEFRLNVSFEELKQCLADATIGLHTMWNEHFGIGVVEIMAAGAMALAHNSGGPKMDIVVAHNGCATGYLADSVESYADGMDIIFKLPVEKSLQIRQNARVASKRFAEEEFETTFLGATESLFSS